MEVPLFLGVPKFSYSRVWDTSKETENQLDMSSRFEETLTCDRHRQTDRHRATASTTLA